MEDNQRLAGRIIAELGGIGQISSLEDEPTRLKLTVNDPDSVNWQNLRHIRGVVRVIADNKNITLVLGPGIAEKVSDAIRKTDGLNESLQKKGLFSWLK